MPLSSAGLITLCEKMAPFELYQSELWQKIYSLRLSYSLRCCHCTIKPALYLFLFLAWQHCSPVCQPEPEETEKCSRSIGITHWAQGREICSAPYSLGPFSPQKCVYKRRLTWWIYSHSWNNLYKLNKKKIHIVITIFKIPNYKETKNQLFSSSFGFVYEFISLSVNMQ